MEQITPSTFALAFFASSKRIALSADAVTSHQRLGIENHLIGSHFEVSFAFGKSISPIIYDDAILRQHMPAGWMQLSILGIELFGF